MTALWNLNSQPRRVFGWTDILQQWSQSLTMHPYVQTVVDNLRSASDPENGRDFPLDHFTNFLNNEQDGLKWFLYETVAMRWMWGEARLDYVRGLVDRIDDLDSFFPNFIGSPNQTIRQFLLDNLNNEERFFVNLPAPAVEHEDDMDADDEDDDISTIQQENEPNTVNVTTSSPFIHPPMNFIIQRSADGNEDDTISIYKTSAGYNLVFNDKLDGFKTYTRDLTRTQVMKCLRNTLRVLTVDDQPFDSIQIQMPNVPNVLVNVKHLTSQTRDLIYDTVESVLEEWPSTR